MGKRRLVIWVGIAAVILVVGYILLCPLLMVRETTTWVCTVSGALKRQTVWFGSISSRPNIEQTALSTWIERNEGAIEYQWKYFGSLRTDPFRWTKAYGSGSAPPIYRMRRLLADFVRLSTEDELRDFVRIMRTGTEPDKKSLVREAADRTLERFE